MSAKIHMSGNRSNIVPRILVVSRRSVRKNKYIDFVGEYHLELLTQFGALPVIVPRVPLTKQLLNALQPFHGLLLTEGEDIGDAFRNDKPPSKDILEMYASDAKPDSSKDAIEFALVKHCLKKGLPILGICRGMQVLNMACGGTTIVDVSVLGGNVSHMDFKNYDGHRHGLTVKRGSPLESWFGLRQLMVNSYHHQGVNRLADRFTPMAYAQDGLIEAYYDPQQYDVHRGAFVIGLQFHPERMRDTEKALKGKADLEYEGCSKPYENLVIAARVWAKDTTKRKETAERDKKHIRRKAANGKFSKQELETLIRSGASVHGRGMIYQVLYGQSEESVEQDVRKSVDQVSEWKQFEVALRQVETVLRTLGDGKRAEQAVNLVKRMVRRYE